ncbi:GNAT family N-acetyltransferase [Streptomyces sp. MUM 203J]|uniref:GNAT family N-acetyltransferase n=1 Tax=Streptomyces sp. MUM 203J TaxID=2791990 RepID=UPI001F0444E2|nr:GNAT family N-acetyltransferase [Streptomyces sp. MUM 203J]MCH0538490.1 GNAT family N-acetyltransferase [Streptomyces sp. MUM 203J]
MGFVVRQVRAEEWPEVRELRLEALRDPVAGIAFLEKYEDAVAQPDVFWQGRAERAAEGGGGDVRQFVAAGTDGRWLGTVTVLVERASGGVRFGAAAEEDQTHLVGVYVRPEARGRGVADALFRAAVEWSWALREPEVRRVRLYVHERNGRAAAFYRRAGFTPSGATMAMEGDPEARELEYEMRRPGATPG